MTTAFLQLMTQNSFGVTASATWAHTECVPAAAVTAPDHPECSSMVPRKKFHRSGRHTFTCGIHTHCLSTVTRTTGLVRSEFIAQPDNRIWFPLTEMSSTEASGWAPGCGGGRVDLGRERGFRNRRVRYRDRHRVRWERRRDSRRRRDGVERGEQRRRRSRPQGCSRHR